MLTKRLIGDFAVAAVTIAFASAYLIATYNLRELSIEDPLGPKAFPFVLGILMLLCGISLAGSTLLRYWREQGTAFEDDEFSGSHPVAVAAVAAWLLAYYLVFEPLGFLLATMLFLFGLMVYFNRGRWLTNIAVSILFPIVLELIFTHVLGSTPAPGILSF